MKSKKLESSFIEIVGLVKSARLSAFRAVNSSLIDLYWEIGGHISKKSKSEEWGKSVVEKLSAFLQKKIPGARGYSAQNLWRMKQFHEAYLSAPNLSSLLRELPWSANLHILSKCKSVEERSFYLEMAIREKWSVRELERQIDGGRFERIENSPLKVSRALRETHPHARQVFKDSYMLDFLGLPMAHSESELQQGLVNGLRDFLTELGRDFCFIGERYQLQVGAKDFFLDLLFYHRELQCLIAFELKINDFKPEYLGKLEFYLEALDRTVRKAHEKPSVGVLLCKSKDSEVVEYALSRTLSPALVSEYQTYLPDKNILQQKLAEFYAIESGNTVIEPAIPKRKRMLNQNLESPIKRNRGRLRNLVSGIRKDRER